LIQKNLIFAIPVMMVVAFGLVIQIKSCVFIAG